MSYKKLGYQDLRHRDGTNKPPVSWRRRNLLVLRRPITPRSLCEKGETLETQNTWDASHSLISIRSGLLLELLLKLVFFLNLHILSSLLRNPRGFVFILFAFGRLGSGTLSRSEQFVSETSPSSFSSSSSSSSSFKGAFPAPFAVFLAGRGALCFRLRLIRPPGPTSSPLCYSSSSTSTILPSLTSGTPLR